MKEKSIETIGGRLKDLRESKKMSQEQLWIHAWMGYDWILMKKLQG